MRSKADMDKAIELARGVLSNAEVSAKMQSSSGVILARALLAASDELERIRPVYAAAVAFGADFGDDDLGGAADLLRVMGSRDTLIAAIDSARAKEKP